jgi:enoyl-CoA hydratase
MAELVLYTKEDHIGIITINRPEARNALNMGIFHALDEILDTASADDVRVLIITGQGNAFVAGADIGELLTLDSYKGWQASRYQQSVFSKLETIGKPSIAALNGFALGGGLELALSCTFRLASATAKLGFPELGLGIIPAFGGTERLVRAVGHTRACELIFFRTIIDAAKAHELGLVNEVTEPGLLMEKARQMAGDLASLSPAAVRLELELLNHAVSQGLDEGLALESALGSVAVSSPEAKELLGAFVAKSKK